MTPKLTIFGTPGTVLYRVSPGGGDLRCSKDGTLDLGCVPQPKNFYIAKTSMQKCQIDTPSRVFLKSPTWEIKVSRISHRSFFKNK